MPISRRYELLAWANEATGRFIIEDDYDSELRVSGRPLPTLCSIDAAGKVIYMNTFSKTLTQTLRISYMVLPPVLAKRFQEELGFLSSTVSTFKQYTLAHFLDEGYFEKHLYRMRTHYRRKRDSLIREIRQSKLADKAKIIEEKAGLHFLLELTSSYDDAELCRRLEAAHIHLAPLTEYYQMAPPEAAHLFLINYSSLEEKNIPAAVARLSSVVCSL